MREGGKEGRREGGREGGRGGEGGREKVHCKCCTLLGTHSTTVECRVGLNSS